MHDITSDRSPVRVQEYHLHADGTSIVYVTRNGEPTLTYNGTSFTGRQIHLEETQLGLLRSVELADGHHLSLALPEALREANAKSVTIETFVIFSRRDPSLDEARRPGQLRHYRVATLSGNAW